MVKCSICEKSLYGASASERLVCSSCTKTESLTDAERSKSKTVHEVTRSMMSLGSQPTNRENEIMSHTLKIKSNSLRCRSQLFGGGSFALYFDEQGIAQCPAVYREAIERELLSRPNRYTILENVQAESPVAAVAAPEVTPTEEAPPEATEIQQKIIENVTKARKTAKKKAEEDEV